MPVRMLISILVVLMGLVCLAQEEKPKLEAKTEAGGGNDAAPAEVDKLMGQLDANRFSERQAAQQKLAELGKAALPALEKGTQHVSREVAVRSLEVIKNHFLGGDDATKGAAKEVLERLAKSNDASLAKRAGEILSPPMPQPQVRPGVAPGRIGNAQIQIQVVGGAGGNVKRVSVKNVNGVKEIEAEENGKKVKITEDPAKGIQMEVTEKKDGKDATQKYEAKDAAELKTKHPHAHKLYEEYTKQPAGIQIRGLAVPGGVLPPGALPPGFPALPAPPAIARQRIKLLRPDDLKGMRDDVDSALQSLEGALKSLKDTKAESEELKKAQEQLEAAKKQVEELKGKLEK